MRHQRISTRDVHHDVLAAFVGIAPLRVRDRFARPVAGMLVEPGQLVKNRAFSDIRVARQRDDPFARAPFDDKAAVDRTFSRGTGC